jgi:putative addiction module CopG family antidote
MNVVLNPASEKMVKGRVESGQSASVEEVLQEALMALEERNREDTEKLERFRAKMQEAEDSMDRGEFVDTEEMFARLRERGLLMWQTAA